MSALAVPISSPPQPLLPLLLPQWGAPAGVGAAMSLRAGGVSAAPWDSLNLGGAVQDDGDAVVANRRRFEEAIRARPVWLRQVHGRNVVRLSGQQQATPTEADAAWTTEPGLACAVLVADCLPVLFSARDGRAVGAAHAGWRGLAGGVLEATVQAMCSGAALQPGDLMAWLGPCIGPRQFEVGADVLQAFGRTAADAAFVERRRPDGSLRWLANMPMLAAQRLAAVGVLSTVNDGSCTAEDRSRFFSFRRDGLTGRMAAAIWRQ